MPIILTVIVMTVIKAPVQVVKETHIHPTNVVVLGMIVRLTPDRVQIRTGH